MLEFDKNEVLIESLGAMRAGEDGWKEPVWRYSATLCVHPTPVTPPFEATTARSLARAPACGSLLPPRQRTNDLADLPWHPLTPSDVSRASEISVQLYLRSSPPSSADQAGMGNSDLFLGGVKLMPDFSVRPTTPLPIARPWRRVYAPFLGCTRAVERAYTPPDR